MVVEDKTDRDERGERREATNASLGCSSSARHRSAIRFA